MNTQEKQQFIIDILETTKQSLLSKVDRMPEHWNGVELRQLIEDYVIENINYGSIKQDRKRYKDYHNDCLVNNL
jgi:hypothetical protein